MKNIFFISFVLIIIISIYGCSSSNINTSRDEYFDNWPEGKSPQTIGKLVAEHFIETPHSKINKLNPGKTITYPEACTWFGALKFAEATSDSKFA